MDYHVKFGMEENPFVKNSKEYIYEGSEYNEIQTRLNYLLTTRGFGLLTGEAGSGKTTAVRNWCKKLNPSLYNVVYSCLSTITVLEFYRNLAAGLGLLPAFRKSDNFKLIHDEIDRLSLEKRIVPVIIIDEANHISNAILNDLKIIFNFEMDSKNKAIILLTGLPVLNSSLNLAANEPLRQRITMNYNISPLSKNEAKNYILKKLDSVRCSKPVFNDSALEALVNASSGIPRLIDKYANTSIIFASSKNLDFIDSDIVMEAVNDCQLG